LIPLAKGGSRNFGNGSPTTKLKLSHSTRCRCAPPPSPYGKGIDPKARLNLADCAAYALAATMNAPLLFKGDDFTTTDVRACL
jgi:uncharacterized protein with PIN domain